jgi:hypothetical protein
MNSKTFATVALVSVALGAAPAIGCVSFGADQPAIDKVQSSWGPAEDEMDSGQYAAAVKELRSTLPFLSLIRDPFIRNCVADGANIRIIAASAGADYLVQSPYDKRGAKAAADRAWKAYPMRHNCP